MTSVFNEAQPVLTSKACHGTGARTRPKAMRRVSSPQQPEGSPSSQASCARTHGAHWFTTGLPCCPPPVWRRGGCKAPRIATCRTGGSTPAPLLPSAPPHAGAPTARRRPSRHSQFPPRVLQRRVSSRDLACPSFSCRWTGAPCLAVAPPASTTTAQQSRDWGHTVLRESCGHA